MDTLMRYISAAGKISWDMGFEICLFVRASELMHVVIRHLRYKEPDSGHGDLYPRDVIL